MHAASELLGLVRLAAGLRSFLKTTITPDVARGLVRRWVEERDGRFLQNTKRAVFDYRRSPYLRLFESAGCEYGDVVAGVRRQGIEATLQTLVKAGVYVSWEEFKGRVPAVRGSRTFHFKEADFDNPLITTYYRITSGGTTGVPVRVRIDLEELAQAAPDWAVLFAAHGWMERPLVFWTPTHAGLASRYLRCVRFGMPYTKWFTMADMSTVPDRLRSAVVHTVARRMARLSKPEAVPVDRAARVCEYLIGMIREGRPPVVNTSPSAAARLSIEAQNRGDSLRDVAFLLGAEPVTPARRRTIEESGATVVPTYGTSECGWIGAQFPGATVADEVHVFRDAYAVIADGGEPQAEPTERPLLFTNLRPAASKVMLNAEIGDSAVLDTEREGWAATALGYTTRLHTIRSFRKITAWGTTFAHADLYRVLEEALPARFGGTLADYQLVEREDERGLSRLVLRVSPRLGALREEDVRSTFLTEISRLKSYYGFMASIISQADALKIERGDPVSTGRGKVVPVITLRTT